MIACQAGVGDETDGIPVLEELVCQGSRRFQQVFELLCFLFPLRFSLAGETTLLDGRSLFITKDTFSIIFLSTE